jgi:hypothetical protein
MSCVHHWAKHCKDGKAGKSKLCDGQGVGQPMTGITEFCREGVDELIKERG